jgi:N-acetyl-gamma-glutamyl-phosphate reductase
MLVSIGLENRLMKKDLDAEDIHKVLTKYYDGEKFIKVLPFNDNSFLADGLLPNAYLTATDCNNTNNLQIMVFGNETQTLIIARLDNLGKGASGAAVQNLNIMLGFDEDDGGI